MKESIANEVFRKIAEQKEILLIIIGGLLLVFGAVDEVKLGDKTFLLGSPGQQVVLNVFGGLLIIFGAILLLREIIAVKRPASPQQKTNQPSSGAEITILAAERSQLSRFYADQSRSAATIDMISLTLLSAMENFGKDEFVQWVRAGKKIRILMLSPLSMAAELRSLEESASKGFLRTKIIKQIEELKSLYATAEKQLRGQDYTGSLEIRVFDDLPYFSYFHTDKVMVMGLYYGHIRGLQSEALLIDEKSSIHTKMRNHFDYLWNKSGNKHGASTVTLFSITKEHIVFSHTLLKSFHSPEN